MFKLNSIRIIFLTLISLFLIFSFSIILLKKNFNIKHSITKSILDNLDIETLKFTKSWFYVHKYKRYDKSIKNDYNVSFLPSTQSINIDYKTKELFYLPDDKKVYEKVWIPKIDQFKDNIFVFSRYGNISYFKKDELFNNFKDNINVNTIKTNLFSFKDIQLKDAKIYNKKIYISLTKLINDPSINEPCKKFEIIVADLNFEFLNFKEFYNFNQVCTDDSHNFNMSGGVLDIYEHNGLEGLIFSTVNKNDGAGADSYLDRLNDKDLLEQSDKSIHGKIGFIDFKKRDLIILSKGHRNVIGIHVNKDVILITENGPRGGDEINKIEYGKNYGWPLASYGETYGSHNNKYTYSKNHYSYGFKEPIYAFVPSLGISEIIKLPNQFSKDWNDNYLIATLNDGHLMRVKFDNKFEKILFNEKIFIGQRIRDIEYIEDLNIILMAFDNGKLGILKQIPHN